MVFTRSGLSTDPQEANNNSGRGKCKPLMYQTYSFLRDFARLYFALLPLPYCARVYALLIIRIIIYALEAVVFYALTATVVSNSSGSDQAEILVDIVNSILGGPQEMRMRRSLNDSLSLAEREILATFNLDTSDFSTFTENLSSSSTTLFTTILTRATTISPAVTSQPDSSPSDTLEMWTTSVSPAMTNTSEEVDSATFLEAWDTKLCLLVTDPAGQIYNYCLPSMPFLDPLLYLLWLAVFLFISGYIIGIVLNLLGSALARPPASSRTCNAHTLPLASPNQSPPEYDRDMSETTTISPA